MERNDRPRRRFEAPHVEPTTITELARRYHSCAVALAKSLGLPLTEGFLRDHRESVSSIFIAADRAGVRLPVGVHLPPLGELAAGRNLPPDPREAAPVVDDTGRYLPPEGPLPPGEGKTTPPITAASVPTSIPAGLQLPCAEALITDLRPAQLALLIGKVGLRSMADKTLEPLHVALLAEWARRFEAGKRAEANGHAP